MYVCNMYEWNEWLNWQVFDGLWDYKALRLQERRECRIVVAGWSSLESCVFILPISFKYGAIAIRKRKSLSLYMSIRMESSIKKIILVLSRRTRFGISIQYFLLLFRLWFGIPIVAGWFWKVFFLDLDLKKHSGIRMRAQRYSFHTFNLTRLIER